LGLIAAFHCVTLGTPPDSWQSNWQLLTWAEQGKPVLPLEHFAVSLDLARIGPLMGTTGGLGCLFLFQQIRLPAAAQDLSARVVA
jgi:hypothetical protein